ncbi:Reduced folate carrier,Major facilitator superfamily domain [Cinara cedri]|uniref:Reduced folate carrier,Major facilitator superfamily domain n=1 Tax=Cinara cedri TaxID=506608 RepID=A0A5E4M7B6_9HEMI|nr:Reduced folate carrier,Major facilitator superfamily domain [Cinara cedri]
MLENLKMEPWKKVCIYVSVYAILRECRPIDPFYIEYVTSLSEKYTDQVIREEIYPVCSYISVFLVIIIFLVTDFLRYKPIIVLNGLAGIVYYGLLLTSPTIATLKTSQVFQALFRAAEIAFYTYMFANIKQKDQYQIATSRLRTSIMIGKCCCGILAQVLISWNFVSYIHLLYLSLLGMFLTTVWSLLMPSAKFSIYFYKEKEPIINYILVDNNQIVETKILYLINGNLDKTSKQKVFVRMNLFEVIQKLWVDFKVAYSDPSVIKWSMWWSLSLCGYVLAAQYIQLLWKEINKNENNHLMNGAVESLATLLSAAVTYAIGMVNGDWDKYGEIIMAIVAVELGVMLSFVGIAESLTQSAELAKCLKRDCYALVFGFNKFIAFIMISIFTVVFVENIFFSFDIRQQGCSNSIVITDWFVGEKKINVD